MQIVLDTAKKTIIWGTKGIDRIAQNITNLLNTFKYEVAYDRTMGMTGAYIDKPRDESIALAAAEIFELISQREPRARVIDVAYDGQDDAGAMLFKVVIEIG